MFRKTTGHFIFLTLVGVFFSPFTHSEIATDTGGATSDNLSSNLSQDQRSTKANPKKRKQQPASEKNPLVVIRGSAAFNAYTGSQKNKETTVFKPNADDSYVTGPSRDASRHFDIGDTKLEFQVGREITGMKDASWRFNLAFSGDKSISAPKFVKQAYITLMSKYATLHLGNYAGVEDTLALSGGSVLGNLGFESGGIYKFAAATTGCHKTLDLVGDTGEATKITLLSPRWKGLMLGVSYTPSTSHFGGADLNTYSSGSSYPYTVNNVAFGLNYVGFVTPDMRLNLSLTGVIAQSRPESLTPVAGQSLQRHGVRSIALGGVVTYKAFSFGAEYAYTGRSMQFTVDRLIRSPMGGLAPLNYTAKDAQGPRWFDLGVSYLYKQTKFSAGYLSSWRKTGIGSTKATAKIYNVSITYQRQPGLDLYIEGYKVNTKNSAALYEGKLLAQSLPSSEKVPSTVTNQKANIIVAGMKVSF